MTATKSLGLSSNVRLSSGKTAAFNLIGLSFRLKNLYFVSKLSQIAVNAFFVVQICKSPLAVTSRLVDLRSDYSKWSMTSLIRAGVPIVNFGTLAFVIVNHTSIVSKYLFKRASVLPVEYFLSRELAPKFPLNKCRWFVARYNSTIFIFSSTKKGSPWFFLDFCSATHLKNKIKY